MSMVWGIRMISGNLAVLRSLLPSCLVCSVGLVASILSLVYLCILLALFFLIEKVFD